MYEAIRKKSIYTLTILLAVLISILLFIEYRINYDISKAVIEKDKKQLSNIYSQTLNSFYNYYEISLKQLLQNKAVVEAFKNKNRKELYNLTKPFYNSLKEQNKYFYNMHFHTVDNKSFLRVHKPRKFGDDLSGFRKIVVETNKTKKIQTGIEPGKHTISLRVVTPIIDNGKHLGSVELGVKLNYFIEFFEKNYNIKSFYIVHNKFLDKLLTFNPKSVDKIGNFSIVQRDKSLIKSLSIKDIDEILHKGRVEHLNEHMFLSEISKIYAFGNKPIGHICFNMDMSYIFERTVKYELIINISFMIFFVIMYLFIKKSFSYFERKATIHSKKIKELSYKDELTKIYNRKKMIKVINYELNRDTRYGIKSSIIIFDIDNFKKINDTYGHNIGDEVLKKLAKVVSSSIRQTDYFARWGGEEFIILTTDTPDSEAMVLADKLQIIIEETLFDTVGKVTCSFGVSKLDSGLTYTESIHNADKALYYSKHNGKNQVTIYSENLNSLI